MKDISKKVFNILNDTPYLYEIFHADTYFVRNINKNYNTSLRFKSYPRFPFVELPQPQKINVKLNSLLEKRVSNKNFDKQVVNLNEISTMLYASIGIKNLKRPYSSKRFIPSAGGLYSVEAYILSMHSSLNTGLYHYNVKLHGLEILANCTKTKIVSLFSDSSIKKTSLIVCLTVKFENVIDKYEDRGYRYALIEAGHIGQNLALTATALDLKSCPIGGYYDELLNKFIHLIPRKEAVVYTFAIG